MFMDKKTVSLITLMLMWFRLTFLFVDHLFSPSVSSPTPVVWLSLAEQERPDSIASELDNTDIVPSQAHNVASAAIASWEIFPSSWNQLLPPVPQQRTLEELHLLESVYKKNKDIHVLATLIQWLATNYQFTDAYTYAQELMKQPGYEKQLDVKTLLYVFLHSDEISLESSTSIQTVLSPLLQQWRGEGLLTQDDVTFYQWLFALWNKDYSGASASFQTLRTPSYLSVVQAYQQALSEATQQIWAPVYYKDALVSLAFLKHGYFAIAKRLALSVLSQNTSYILPYQVLAYANFLSTHREAAAQYFLTLIDLDHTHASEYTFLVGVSEYWMGNYDQSLLYLNQVQDTPVMTDVYRYQLLSSLALQDTDGALRIWQKLLWQSDIADWDFQFFFENFFFFPYRSGQPFTLYTQNTQLSTMYTQSCAQHFSGQQDVCLYGDIAQWLVQQNWTWLARPLLYLSTRYHQSYLYHVLGDYYVINKQYSQAKEAYSRALTLCDDANEEILLQNKLQKVLQISS